MSGILLEHFHAMFFSIVLEVILYLHIKQSPQRLAVFVAKML